MPFQHKDGQASLFPNNNKTKDNQPDWRGDGLYNGQEVELAGWTKQGRNGEFLSLTIKPKQARHGGGGGPIRPTLPKMNVPHNDAAMDDNIPFSPER